MVPAARLRARVVASRKDNFVRLPRELCNALAESLGPKRGPVALELVELTPPCRRHLVAFAGMATAEPGGGRGAARGAGYARHRGEGEGRVEVPQELAETLGIVEGTPVRVREPTREVPTASRATIAPLSEGDYAALNLSSRSAEEGDVLSQVGLLTVGQSFPLWVERNKQIVRFAVKSLEVGGAPAQLGTAMIRLGTELVVLGPEAAKPVPGGARAAAEAPEEEAMRPAEARVMRLSRDALPSLGIEAAALVPVEGGGDEGVLVWAAAGFASPCLMRAIAPGLGSGGSVLARIVPRALEGAKEGANPRPTPVCVRLSEAAGVAPGHLALSGAAMDALGAEDLQRAVVAPVGLRGWPRPEAVAFKVEVSEIIREGDGEEGEQALAADAQALERAIAALLGCSGAGGPSVVHRGMVLDLEDASGRRRSRFEITAVLAAGPDDKLTDLRGLDHICVMPSAAVEVEVSMGQPSRWRGTEEHEELEVLDTPWLLEAVGACSPTLRVCLDDRVASKFLDAGVPFPGGVLVHGPAGGGKTALCRSMSRHFSLSQTPAKTVWLDCQNFAAADLEKMKRGLRVAFSRAVECQPSLLVCENVDALCSTQGDGQATLDSLKFSVFSETFSDLVDETRRGSHRVSLLATARSLDATHKSLKKSGCLDTHLAMPVPTRTQKAQIFRAILERKRIGDATGEAAAALEANCDGLDVKDVESIAELALLESLSNVEAGGGSFGLAPGQMERILQSYVPARARGAAKDLEADAKYRDWGDVKGMDRARDELKDLLSFSAEHKDLIDLCPLRLRTGALVYGPPGSGKTFLVKCAAAICGLRVISVKGPELLNKYIGQSEAGVRDLFEKASGASPCVLFFDEFDAIAPKRGHDSTGVTDRVVNQFLAEMDGIESLSGVFVLAATSRPDLVDPALLRPGRLDCRIKLDFPSEEERLEILGHELGGAGGVSGEVLRDVARGAEGWTGADLAGLVGEAELMAAQAIIQREGGPPTAEDDAAGAEVVVTEATLRKAMAGIRKSVSEQERRRLDTLYHAFEHGETEGGAKRVTHA